MARKLRVCMRREETKEPTGRAMVRAAGRRLCKGNQSKRRGGMQSRAEQPEY